MRLSVVVCCLTLAACGGGGGPAFDVPKLTRSAPESVSVAQGDVVIAGPPGYCIDKRSSRLRGATPFVLLAGCSSVTGSAEAGQPSTPGLLTASVDQRKGNPPSTESLSAFLKTDTGRASLAKDGRASSVEILDSNIVNGALLLRIRDRGGGGSPGLDPTYWRGLFILNSRLVTITATAFEARPIGSATLKGKLVAFMRRIQEETPAAPPGRAPEARPLQGLFQRFSR